jgi:hypothetical protein
MCHDQSGHTAWRLVTLRDDYHSVSNAACQDCHHAADHASGLVVVDSASSSCVDCHQEHRPDRGLSDVTDSNCTRCHRQLERDDGTAVNFFSAIDQFEAGSGEHPEFAMLRTNDREVGPRHGARSVAAFAGQGDGGRWIERGGILFNHKVHLDPAGVMHPDGKQRPLDCAACHVPDASGEFMQPIQYETHCQECHPLRLSGPLGRLGTLPHSSVEEVRGVLRERIIQLAADESAQEPSDEREAAVPRLPLLPSPTRLAAEDERKVDAAMVRADHAVFGLEAKGMCRKCHRVEPDSDTWKVFVINSVAESLDSAADDAAKAKMIPNRWLMHGEFQHDSHRAIECVACHDVRNSSETTDILLPSIANCRSCHGSGALSSNAQVRADCVLCHTYHDQPSHGKSDKGHGVPLEQLLGTATAESDTLEHFQIPYSGGWLGSTAGSPQRAGGSLRSTPATRYTVSGNALASP